MRKFEKLEVVMLSRREPEPEGEAPPSVELMERAVADLRLPGSLQSAMTEVADLRHRRELLVIERRDLCQANAAKHDISLHPRIDALTQQIATLDRQSGPLLDRLARERADFSPVVATALTDYRAGAAAQAEAAIVRLEEARVLLWRADRIAARHAADLPHRVQLPDLRRERLILRQLAGTEREAAE